MMMMMKAPHHAPCSSGPHGDRRALTPTCRAHHTCRPAVATRPAGERTPGVQQQQQEAPEAWQHHVSSRLLPRKHQHLAGIAVTSGAWWAGSAQAVEQATSSAAQAAAAAGGYVPSPYEPGWEVWVGFVAGVVPFAIGSWEFGKRIVSRWQARGKLAPSRSC